MRSKQKILREIELKENTIVELNEYYLRPEATQEEIEKGDVIIDTLFDELDVLRNELEKIR